MPTLFAGPTGRVVKLVDEATQATFQPLLSQKNTDASKNLSFAAQKSIVTGVTVAEQTSQQFAHMLGGDIYVYAFGDRIGQMTISGLAFAVDCADIATTGGLAETARTHGIEKMREWYRKYRISNANNKGEPLKFLIGRGTPFDAYLVGFSAHLNDPRQLLVQYQLSLFLVPEEDTLV